MGAIIGLCAEHGWWAWLGKVGGIDCDFLGLVYYLVGGYFIFMWPNINIL